MLLTRSAQVVGLDNAPEDDVETADSLRPRCCVEYRDTAAMCTVFDFYGAPSCKQWSVYGSVSQRARISIRLRIVACRTRLPTT